MYENENNQNESSGTTGSQYRYSGPFYQDNYDSKSSYNSGSESSYGSSTSRYDNSSSYSSNNSYNYNSYNSGSYGSGTSEKPKKKKKSFLRLVAKTVCVALVFGVVASAAFQGTNYLGKQIFGDDVTAAAEETTAVPEIETVTPSSSGTAAASTAGVLDVTDIVEKCMPSVVAITNISVTEVKNYWGFGWYGTPQQQEQSSSGTGIIIGQNDTELLIVTNNHVIENATTLTVLFSVDEGKDGAEAVEARIKGTDATKDVGVIAVNLEDIPAETLDEIKIATIGDSSQLKVGEPVVAIGNALGYGQSVTTGIISAMNREVALQNEDGTVITNSLIQTDAAINPGNSGGALLNLKGEVIGINEAKYSAVEAEGVGYAIPISDVESLIGDLKTMTTRSVVADDKMGYLGITCQDVTEDVSKMYDMPVGVFISSVVDGCAAQKAGLQKGDILTKFDGVTVTSYDSLKARLQYYEAGETVEVTVQSPEGAEYVEKTVTLTLNTKAEVEKASN